MNNNYKFAILDPRNVPAAQVANDAIFASGQVLGIEVTVPALASRCLVNLDHHGQADTSETPSACEQALHTTWCGVCLDSGTIWNGRDGVDSEAIPCVACGGRPPFDVMATVRPDADSVTAMAMIHNRYKNCGIDSSIIADVGAFDRLGPSVGKPSALVSAIARKATDFKFTLEERVIWVADLLAGADKSEEISTLNAAHEAELEAARKASELTLHADGRIACVVSTDRFATTLGYESASVVIAQNPSMQVDPRDSSKGVYNKYTVCRYDSHVACDLPAALKELQVLEAGWGGRGDIFGSPQGISSTLTVEQVIEVVSRHLK